MFIELWSLGKEDKNEIKDAIQIYVQRLGHYTNFKLVTIDNSKVIKNTTKEIILEKESDLILNRLNEKDMLITLDEYGSQLSSIKFSQKINQWMNMSPSRIIFLIGGSYGIGNSVHQRAIFKMSLSELTFPHQLVRLIFSEQLYRAFTILKNEKYHHQ